MRQSRWPRVPMAEHREPCESRGSRTVLGAPGGEIPPGDSTLSDIPRLRSRVRFRGQSGHRLIVAHQSQFMSPRPRAKIRMIFQRHRL